jgi:hypothetical protein
MPKEVHYFLGSCGHACSGSLDRYGVRCMINFFYMFIYQLSFFICERKNLYFKILLCKLIFARKKFLEFI